jgi:hypothetical protein
MFLAHSNPEWVHYDLVPIISISILVFALGILLLRNVGRIISKFLLTLIVESGIYLFTVGTINA